MHVFLCQKVRRIATMKQDMQLICRFFRYLSQAVKEKNAIKLAVISKIIVTLSPK